MDNNDKHVISRIKELIEVAKEGEKGFREASENVEDPRLKDILNRFSLQRARFKQELEHALTTQYHTTIEEPEDSTLSKIHRTWIDLKSKVANDVESILEECHRGDNHALDKYNSVLEEYLPTNIQLVVEGQRDQINEIIRELEEYEDSMQ